MFWGVILKQGANHKLTDGEVDVVHVSNAALGQAAEGRVQLYAKVDSKEFVLANFEKGKVEQTPLDLYFRVDQGVEFGVKGKGDVHLSGYIEPDVDADDLDDDEGVESDEEDAEEVNPTQTSIV